jgi:hypothetical protein
VTFVADCMLGRLAKWLRILGFDVLYFSKAEDPDLVAIARREGRVLLTRDTGLIERTARRPDRLFIRSVAWEDQVVQVLDEFGLWDTVRPNTRCIACNLPLKLLSREQARNLVTPYVGERAASFAVCPGCERVFWQGTHYGDMERKIGRLLERRGRPAA